MPRKKKTTDPIGVGISMSAKQMKRKKPINTDMMRDIEPLTDNQKKLFESYKNGKNLVAYGAAGTVRLLLLFIMLLEKLLIQPLLTIRFTL